MYLTTSQVPSVYQWDSSSRYPTPDPGSAASNCGPTCITFIANFYRDRSYGIYATRRLVVDDPTRGTSANEQRDMLKARGVPAYIGQPDVEEMHRLVGSGRRPIVVGLWMAKVPAEIRDHPFLGMHAIVLRRTVVKNGVVGFEVLDPNFSRNIRPDPDEGKKFYPDWVIRSAFVNRVGSTSRGWAVIPAAEKELPDQFSEEVEMALLERFRPDPVPRRFPVKKGTSIYDGPGTRYPKRFTLPTDDYFQLVGWATDEQGRDTGWVWASRPGQIGVFAIPPEH